MSIKSILLLAALPLCASAQTDYGKVTVTGSIQSDVLIPQEDKKIGADILSDIRRSGSKLSEQLASQLLVFDDIVKIDDEILSSFDIIAMQSASISLAFEASYGSSFPYGSVTVIVYPFRF